jgi:hypothetical protein
VALLRIGSRFRSRPPSHHLPISSVGLLQRSFYHRHIAAAATTCGAAISFHRYLLQVGGGGSEESKLLSK